MNITRHNEDNSFCFWHRPYWSLLICFVCSLALPSAADGAQESGPLPVVSIGSPSSNGAVQETRVPIAHGLIRLTPGAASGTVPVIVTAERLNKDLMGLPPKLAIDEYESAASPQIVFTLQGELQPGASGRTWLFTADIKGLMPNTDQKRYARLSLGEFQRIIEFVVTNRPAGNYTWSIAAPPTIVGWRVGGASAALAALVITVGEVPASGLKIAQHALREKVTGAALDPGALELCATPTGDCMEIGTLEANRSHTVYLRGMKDNWRYGNFTGSLLLRVDQKQDTYKLDLQLLSSSLAAKLSGCLLICIGVFFAYRLTVWGNARAARFQALLPVAAVQRRLNGLLKQIDLLDFRNTAAWTRLNVRVDELRERVGETILDEKGMLPPERPHFYKNGNVVDIAPYLASVEQEAAGITLLIREGVIPMVQSAKTHEREQKEEYLTALDRVTTDLHKVISEETGREHIKSAELPDLRERRVVTPSSDIRPSLTVEQIKNALESINGWAWLMWGVLVSLGGMVAMVLTEPGFGTLLDYVLCFLWGFGVPLAAGKMKDLTPSTISTSLTAGPSK